MGEDNGVGWQTCSEDGCVGIRLAEGGKCLAHANDQNLDAELKRFRDEGTIDARGVTISATLLDRIRAAALHSAQQPDRPHFNKASFDRARFESETNFDDASFGDQASFGHATFEGASFGAATFGDDANFGGATFNDSASFPDATFGNRAGFADTTFGRNATFQRASFGHEANFVSATFRDQADFRASFGNRAGFGLATFGDQATFLGATFGDQATFLGATFGDQATFDGTRFGNWASFGGGIYWIEFWDKTSFEHAMAEASFGGASFGDQARFVGARFEEGAHFDAATFGDEASFDRAAFGDEASFDRAAFGDQASFGGAIFGNWARFGPLLGDGQLDLRQATFGQGSELAISADRLNCDAMRLPDGAVLRVRWAEVRLGGVTLGRPSVLAGVGPFAELDETPLQRRCSGSWRSERPRVLWLRGSDVRNLVLSNLDLHACRFTGAYNLDQLRLEATIDLARPPSGLKVGWTVPPLWRWTRRRTLAEEHCWRRTQDKHAGWYPRACRARGLAGQESLLPADIALLYRALRKGREDLKDEPGAADFYYGEMEMRRKDKTAPWPERVVLWLYWLSAGYALRASRALGCLLGLLVVATVLLASVGFAPPPAPAPLSATIVGTPPRQQIQFNTTPPSMMTAEKPLPDRLGAAALVAAEAAVFRTSDQALTYRGRLIQAILRFVGPVLLGLALLSIRGRVKR
jgi:hypothetical protein